MYLLSHCLSETRGARSGEVKGREVSGQRLSVERPLYGTQKPFGAVASDVRSAPRSGRQLIGF